MANHVRSPIAPAERDEIEHAVARWNATTSIDHIERLDGWTNRSYKVVTGAGSLAVRLAGRGTDAYIDRRAERHNAQLAAALGIGATILHCDRTALVCSFIQGRVLTPADLQREPDTLVRVGRHLRWLHHSGASFRSRFDPLAVISEHRARLDRVPAGVDELIARLPSPDPAEAVAPCHIDPWPENFIDTGRRLYLLDWEYSGMGEPAWDLADLVVEAELDPAHQEQLLHAYTRGDPDPELRRRVAQLAPVTDVLWGLWALVQERDGNEAEDFGAYGRGRLTRACHRSTQ